MRPNRREAPAATRPPSRARALALLALPALAAALRGGAPLPRALRRVVTRRRPCSLSATRLPGFEQKVPKLRRAVVPPAENADGWCLGRESVENALAELRAGRPVLVTDDADRENEGDLIFAAENVTPETIAFTVRHTSGVICVALPGSRLDELHLRPMVTRNEDPKGTAFAVTVDLKGGDVTTGISAADRARTIRALADPAAGPERFCRPGHIFPLRARPGGVLERGGHTEAAVDLSRLAGLAPLGGLCEVVRDVDGEMSRWDDLRTFAAEHDLVLTTIADLQAYRRAVGDVPAPPQPAPAKGLARSAATRMPTAHGPFEAICYEDPAGHEHVVLVTGDLTSTDAPLVRIHSECATGDLFGSMRCDCGPQLQRSLVELQKAESGCLVYLRGHEGRGIGLHAKLAAYAIQDAGRDTVEANLDLGHSVDARSYEIAAAVLADLGIDRVRLLTNNPAKCDALTELGIAVEERVPLVTTPNEENYKYLLTKQRKMGHLLGLPDAPSPS